MDQDLQLLLEMYTQQVSRSEHFERLRVSISNITLALAAGLLGLATLDGRLSVTDVWTGSALVLLGIFGLLAAAAHGKRAHRHGERAAAYRDELDSRAPDAGINRVRDTVNVSRSHLNRIWSGLHLGVCLVGVAVTLAAVVQW